MCETCNAGGFNRREFLKISGAAATFGALWSATTLAHNIDETPNIPYIEKKKTKMSVLFMYPPEDVVNAGKLEAPRAEYRWHPYPGYQFEAKMNREKFTEKIVEFAKSYDIELDFHKDAIYTKAATAEYTAKMKVMLPDTLLVFNFCSAFSEWVYEMSQQLASLPMIVYHPTGAFHQLPPQNLVKAPNMVYINSIENWEALENAMAAANAMKIMSHSRLLRVNSTKEMAKEVDPNLGIEIISIPAAEYNDLFDSIKPDNTMISDAMAFKAKAKAVIDVEDKYFIAGFRSRKAVLDLMKRYEADGITIDCLSLEERKPCIAFSLNNSALIPCGCEDFAESAMSLMIGAKLFKRGGFLHNPGFDVERNQYYGTHCTSPLELHGPGKGEMPFRIRPFMHHLPKTAAIDVQMTPEEKVFLMKYIPWENRIFAYSGTMVGSPEVTVAGGCATRFVMNVDKVDNICSIYQGCHPILYYGTVMEARRLKSFAKLTKLEFVGNV